MESSAALRSSPRAAVPEGLREEHGHGLQRADLYAVTFEELLDVEATAPTRDDVSTAGVTSSRVTYGC